MKRLLPALLLLMLVCPVRAAEVPDQPHIVVSGQAEIQAVPDTLFLSLALIAVGQDVAEPSRVVSERATTLIATLKRHGVEARDIRAAGLDITPHYNWNNKVQIYTGTEVTQLIDVTLRDLGRYNDLFRAIIDSKVVRINSTRLESSKAKELRRDALQAAIDDARQQAERLAAGFGAKLGPVYAVTGGGRRYADMDMYTARRSEVVAFEPGEITLSESVQVVFYLQQ